jgi:hypothetical protein
LNAAGGFDQWFDSIGWSEMMEQADYDEVSAGGVSDDDFQQLERSLLGEAANTNNNNSRKRKRTSDSGSSNKRRKITNKRDTLEACTVVQDDGHSLCVVLVNDTHYSRMKVVQYKQQFYFTNRHGKFGNKGCFSGGSTPYQQ